MKRFGHKTALLFSIILLFTLALPISVLADTGTGGNEFTKTVNGYQITLIFEKPAFVGENHINVLVKDTMNMPISMSNLEIGVVDTQAETINVQPTAEIEKMGGMDATSTPKSEMSGMGGMTTQPTATIVAMSGMDAQPAAAAEPMSGMSSTDVQPVQTHAEMGMVALSAGPHVGEYSGQISIESDGDLIVRIHYTTAGKLTEVDFPVHVAKSSSGAIVLGSFFAVNVALVSAAVFMKTKRISIDPSKKA